MSYFKVGDKVKVCEDSVFSFRGKVVEVAENKGSKYTLVKTKTGKFCVANIELEPVDVPFNTLIHIDASEIEAQIEARIEATEEVETVTPIKHLSNPNLLTCAGFNYRLGLNGDNL